MFCHRWLSILSASRWGGDGALQVWQATGLPMWPDRPHREAENKGWACWWGRLGAQSGWRTCCLHWTRRGQHLWLKLQQLTHEAEIGWDDAAPLLDELESLIQAHALLLHQVCQANCGWAWNPCLTVNKDTTVGVFHRVCGKENGKFLLNINRPTPSSLNSWPEELLKGTKKKNRHCLITQSGIKGSKAAWHLKWENSSHTNSTAWGGFFTPLCPTGTCKRQHLVFTNELLVINSEVRNQWQHKRRE